MSDIEIRVFNYLGYSTHITIAQHLIIDRSDRRQRLERAAQRAITLNKPLIDHDVLQQVMNGI